MQTWRTGGGSRVYFGLFASVPHMCPAYAESSRPADEPRRVRRLFERRAAAFDAVEFLPREVAARMRERLEYIKMEPARLLDLGCGRGDDHAPLLARFPDAAWFGADLSAAMLARARERLAQADAGGGWRRLLPASLAKAFGARQPALTQTDFAALPFAGGAFDLLWSNLALHWHAHPDAVIPEWQRVLRVGGLLMFSTLGPDTLRELRAACAAADLACGLPEAHARVIDFVDMHDLGDMLVASGFEIPVMDQEKLTVTYRSADALLADVRRWGGYPFARAEAPASRRWWRALGDALEARRREDGTLALTFELIYGHAWKAVPRMTPEGHGIVRLEDIGRNRPPRP